MDTPTQEPAAVAPAPAAAALFWQDYQATRLDWFRTRESFQWFRRQHEAELIAAGALAVIAGRVFVVPSIFDAAVIQIGRRLAAARAA